MDFEFTSEQQLLQDSLRRYLKDAMPLIPSFGRRSPPRPGHCGVSDLSGHGGPIEYLAVLRAIFSFNFCVLLKIARCYEFCDGLAGAR